MDEVPEMIFQALQEGARRLAAETHAYDPVKGSLFDNDAFEPWLLIVVTVLVIGLGSLAAGAGIGGGGLFVPLFAFVLGVGAKAAVPMSKATILGGAMGNMMSLAFARHPDPSRNKPLIDYEASTFMQSGELLGVVFGVLLNLVLPEILIIVFLSLLLSFNAYKTLQKGVQKYREETQRFRKKEEEEEAKEKEAEGEKKAAIANTDQGSEASTPSNPPSDYNKSKSDSSSTGTEFDNDLAHQPADTQQDITTEAVTLDDVVLFDGAGDPEHQKKASTNVHCFSSLFPCMDVSPPPTRTRVESTAVPAQPAQPELAKTQQDVEVEAAIVENLPDPERAVSTRSQKLQKVIDEEKAQFPLWAWSLLTPMTLYTILYALVKKSVVSTCQPVAYWLWYFTPVPVLGCFMYVTAMILKRLHKRRIAAGYEFHGDGEEKPDYRDLKWDNSILKRFPAIALLAGVAAGLLGIGGGMVIGPLFIQLDMQPKVGSSSCAFMILWTAASGVVQYAAAGKLGWEFILYGIVVGFVSGQIGQRGVDTMLKKSGRPSMVIFLLGSIVLVACLAMTGTGIFKFIKGIADGDDLFKFDTYDLECHQ